VPTFARAYSDVLGFIFSVPGDNCHVVDYFTAKAHSLSKRDKHRHLCHVSASPFFWIEPTTLFDDVIPTDAQNAGFGTLACITRPTVKPLFESTTNITTHGMHVHFIATMRTVRTSAFVIHASESKVDGLAAIVPRQVGSDDLVFRGTGQRVQGHVLYAPVTKLLETGAGLDKYMWRRAHSTIPAPAELINKNGLWGFSVVNAAFDATAFSYTTTNMPDGQDIQTGRVVLTARRPLLMGNVAMHGAIDRDVLRVRTAASVSLDNVSRLLGRDSGTAHVMQVSTERISRTVMPIRDTMVSGVSEPVVPYTAESSAGADVVHRVPPVVVDGASVLKPAHRPAGTAGGGGAHTYAFTPGDSGGGVHNPMPSPAPYVDVHSDGTTSLVTPGHTGTSGQSDSIGTGEPSRAAK
jgi:hypothetical protein